MSNILTPSRGPDDWQQFLADPQKQWKRGYSAMAAPLSPDSTQAADNRAIERQLMAIFGWITMKEAWW